MEPRSVERKLTAILSADVKGYSHLMGEDEVGTLRTLTAYREVTDSLIQQHRGRVVGSAGDSVLAEFASVVDAVQCAVEIQQELKVRNAELPPDHRMEFRIGINLGDVIVQGEQIYGDDVNIAARLESLAEGGGICISGTVHEHIKNKLALNYEDLGEQKVKNIAEPVRVWRVLMESATVSPSVGAAPRGRPQTRRQGTTHLPRVVWVVVVILLIGAGTLLIRNLLQSPTSRQPQGVAPTTSQTRAPADQAPALPLPDKPSIVVLPFVNMSSDPEQEYFSDGITEDLTTDLSKISNLFVIARNSAFTYKGKAVKVQEVGQELGVRYVLEGSVRKLGDQVRITAQLVDATTGHHLWTERYNRPLQEIFAVQDEIRQQIVAALRVEVTQAELERVRRIPTDNLTAYDYVLRGVEHFRRVTKEANIQAQQMFEKAIALDPQYADAYALVGFTYFTEWFMGWGQDPHVLEQALALAQKGRTLDDSLPAAHLLLSLVYTWKKQDEQALAEAEWAIALDPNDSFAYIRLGSILYFTGRPAEGVEVIEKAMRLNPYYPADDLLNLGMAYRLAGRYEEAVAALKRGLARNPDLGRNPHLLLAELYSQLGREEEARAEAAEHLRRNPDFSLEVFRQRFPLQDQVELQRIIDNLRKAGLK